MRVVPPADRHRHGGGGSPRAAHHRARHVQREHATALGHEGGVDADADLGPRPGDLAARGSQAGRGSGQGQCLGQAHGRSVVEGPRPLRHREAPAGGDGAASGDGARAGRRRTERGGDQRRQGHRPDGRREDRHHGRSGGAEARDRSTHWRRWGPYLSDRQWGTVREDYSSGGNAWEYFPHDHARSRAYRWGEDGLLGISDNHQRLCFGLTLWNERDAILKERLFGLAGPEGNHGEDVKEYYFHLDATPTYSYSKALYKYPQAEFPYALLVEENRRRGRSAPEFELLDTGVFDDDRYFDVFIEYAKAAADDILIVVTVVNRGPEAAPLHVLPTLWLRNTWSWDRDTERPRLRAIDRLSDCVVVRGVHPTLTRAFRLFSAVDRAL